MLPKRIEVCAALDKPVFGRVTFYSQVDGTPDQYLGTDQAPPYRIFLDPFPYVGGKVQIKAVYEDTFGGSCTAVVEGLSFKIDRH